MITRVSLIYSLALMLFHLVVLESETCGKYKGLSPRNLNFSQMRSSALNQKTAQREKDNRTQSLISSLSSEEESRRVEAEHEIIGLARTSPQQRKKIVQELLISVEEQDKLDGRHGFLGETFPYWSSVTTIFAELKSREAIDVMVKNIHCGNGYSGSLGKQPAYDALVRMGKITVPKLSEALLHESDVYKRGQIVRCLGNIGGAQAKMVLKRALHSERDKEVLNYIKNALSTITRQS